MNEPEPPQFQWGQRVRATGDLFNDGSYPDHPADALLVKASDRGEIVQVGTHVETGTRIYLAGLASAWLWAVSKAESIPCKRPLLHF